MDTPDTVYFLSDYGTRDTFVGVVHAVLRRLAASACVIDLTHEVAPFDVRGGAVALAQAVPHLGPGVVLAVVDPGVGGGRRCVALRVTDGDGPQWLVGPDNGLLVPALDARGPVDAWALPPVAPAAAARTFDGRDVLAPAVAAICRGEFRGEEIDPAGLVRLPAPVVEHDRREGRTTVRAEVTALDRFGNVQLAARPQDLATTADVVTVVHLDGGPTSVRWVRTFGELAQDELGLLVDSSGHLALVMAEASAADALHVAAGDLVELTT